MNEDKKAKREYMNPVETKQNQLAEELLSAITTFIKKNKLKAQDWIMLMNMTKQIKSNKNTVTNKVLRAQKNKFIKLQRHYQK